jgi:hypothetical protein
MKGHGDLRLLVYGGHLKYLGRTRSAVMFRDRALNNKIIKDGYRWWTWDEETRTATLSKVKRPGAKEAGARRLAVCNITPADYSGEWQENAARTRLTVTVGERLTLQKPKEMKAAAAKEQLEEKLEELYKQDFIVMSASEFDEWQNEIKALELRISRLVTD